MQGWGRRTQGARRAGREVLGRLLRGDAERGDVPGWVLITLMTAGLVIALWAVAGPALTQAFSDAISSVGAP
ncbi:hypothetical protein ACFVTZ_14130 [Cellulosimicrobium cellulans]|uniref:hypothetical protein n=1 Tax=Cellulosimicrobium cellulans TaxID=1710 RepID=UPI0036E2CA45